MCKNDHQFIISKLYDFLTLVQRLQQLDYRDQAFDFTCLQGYLDGLADQIYFGGIGRDGLA